MSDEPSEVEFDELLARFERMLEELYKICRRIAGRHLGTEVRRRFGPSTAVQETMGAVSEAIKSRRIKARSEDDLRRYAVSTLYRVIDDGLRRNLGAEMRDIRSERHNADVATLRSSEHTPDMRIEFEELVKLCADKIQADKHELRAYTGLLYLQLAYDAPTHHTLRAYICEKADAMGCARPSLSAVRMWVAHAKAIIKETLENGQ